MPIEVKSAPFINVPFVVTSGFELDRPDHHALDLATNGEANLYSIIEGTVIENSYYDTNGYYIIIKNTINNVGVLYCHLKEPSSLKVGDKVLINQYVGIEGKSGVATGIHVHVEMELMRSNTWDYSENANYINPADYMGIPNEVSSTQYIYYGTIPTPPTPSTKARKFPWFIIEKNRRNMLK